MICAALAGLLALFACREGGAVVVRLKSGEQPVAGRLVRENAREVVVAELLPDGRYRHRTVARNQIEQVVRTVSPQRLESLNPGNPAAYRDYAEELSEKRIDPEARETAIRLYLIAAHLNPQQLGYPALLGMIDLARSADESRRFRAMAYRLDKDRDPRILRLKRPAPAAPNSEERGDLAAGLRMLRRENWRAALRFFTRDGVRDEIKRQTLLTWDELEKACAAEKRLSDELLRRVLIVESSLSGKPGAADPSDGDERASEPAILSWSEGVRRNGNAPLRPLSLVTITEFDPRQCVFRNGRWQAPRK